MRRPDPTFKGCWHCGGDHRRTKCPEFLDLNKSKSGLPDKCPVLYERTKAGTVKAVLQTAADAPAAPPARATAGVHALMDDHPETFLAWSLLDK